MFFAEKDQPSYHLKKAGANFLAATGISVFGGLTTGLIAAVPALNGNTTVKTTKNDNVTFIYIVGGATVISTIIFTIIAGEELRAAGKAMEKIQFNQNGVTINL